MKILSTPWEIRLAPDYIRFGFLLMIKSFLRTGLKMKKFCLNLFSALNGFLKWFSSLDEVSSDTTLLAYIIPQSSMIHQEMFKQVRFTMIRWTALPSQYLSIQPNYKYWDGSALIRPSSSRRQCLRWSWRPSRGERRWTTPHTWILKG